MDDSFESEETRKIMEELEQTEELMEKELSENNWVNCDMIWIYQEIDTTLLSDFNNYKLTTTHSTHSVYFTDNFYRRWLRQSA